jgi:hypothetical protein
MNDPNEWIKNLVPPEQVAQMQSSAEKIINQDESFYEMSVRMSQQDMIEAVRAGYGMKLGDQESWIIGTGILMSLLGTMEYALKRDDIDIWEED